VCIVRASRIPDARTLARTLADAGLPIVEFSLTTHGALQAIEAASTVDTAIIGAGTVLTTEDARRVIDAGARYLITPGVRPEVAEVAARAGIPTILGALTPTEVLEAYELGSVAVKVFPAHRMGPGYFRDLSNGPYPDIPLLASGGINAENAADYLRSGAVAVAAGSSVVPAAAVEQGDWPSIAAKAAAFTKALRSTESTHGQA
jgi:2-dehydro-3-deoxyphosphogluconate aldolase/(4S)-4-hydroxy-2-oxoglutarate aldolase